MDPLNSDAPLIVYMDVKSPFAFVALEPTLQLELALGARFEWRPLTLDIPSYLGAARKERGRLVSSDRSAALAARIRYGYLDARRYAERQGLTLKGTEKIWDSRLANIGLLWAARTARDRLPAYLRAVCPPFWRRELDIEDMAVVIACLERAGADPTGFAAFAAGEGRRSHDALQAALHPSGVFGAPTYVLEGEPWFGREHIPYLRWALSGRRGAAPDAAFEI